jgi:uncharacterized protein YegP (UPF0339 family)
VSKLDFYVDAAGFHRWRLVAANGRVIDASSEGFSSQQAAEKNYRLVTAERGKQMQGDDQ